MNLKKLKDDLFVNSEGVINYKSIYSPIRFSKNVDDRGICGFKPNETFSFRSGVYALLKFQETIPDPFYDTSIDCQKWLKYQYNKKLGISESVTYSDRAVSSLEETLFKDLYTQFKKAIQDWFLGKNQELKSDNYLYDFDYLHKYLSFKSLKEKNSKFVITLNLHCPVSSSNSELLTNFIDFVLKQGKFDISPTISIKPVVGVESSEKFMGDFKKSNNIYFDSEEYYNLLKSRGLDDKTALNYANSAKAEFDKSLEKYGVGIIHKLPFVGKRAHLKNFVKSIFEPVGNNPINAFCDCILDDFYTTGTTMHSLKSNLLSKYKDARTIIPVVLFKKE